MPEGSSSSIDPAQIRNTLLVREHARADAWLQKDRRALDALLAPDFTEDNQLGKFDRTGVLDTLFPSLSLKVFTITEPRLENIHDAENAVLTYHCYEEMTVTDKEIKGKFTVRAHYRKKKKQWELVRWEISPAAGS